MTRCIFALLFCLTGLSFADNINNYMNIATRIPKMELKADENAQTWARSARNVLVITNESIAETIVAANMLASQKGQPLFCLPPQVHLDAATLKGLIEALYPQLPEKENVTVSTVAWMAVQKAYPCHPEHAANNDPWMKHETAG